MKDLAKAMSLYLTYSSKRKRKLSIEDWNMSKDELGQHANDKV